MRRFLLNVLCLAACGGSPDRNGLPPNELPADRPPPPYAYTILTKQGRRVDWSANGSIIAYDTMGADGRSSSVTSRAPATRSKPWFLAKRASGF